MSFKKRKIRIATASIARAAELGVSTDELVRQALALLAQSGGADRFGVWLRSSEAGRPTIFRELLRGATIGRSPEALPEHWSQLSPERLPPIQRLSEGKTVEETLLRKASPEELDPFTRFRSLVWVPVLQSGFLSGLMLAGSRKAAAALPRETMESLAAELSLALALSSERELGRQRLMDAKFCREILSDLGKREYSAGLARIVDSCTDRAGTAGVGAQFAAIAAVGGPADPGPSEGDFGYAWKSGPSAWSEILESEQVAALRRRALASGRISGLEVLPPRTSEKGPSRALAIPLTAGKSAVGLLVVIVAAPQISLPMLDRLEVRASCASCALALAGGANEESRNLAGDADNPQNEMVGEYRSRAAVRSALPHRERLATLGEMASGVAHELSNPLSSIVGYAQRLLAKQEDPERGEEIRRILAEAERASDILRQMLLTARETRREHQLISLNEVVERTVELQRFALAAEKIRTELSLGPNLPFLLADPGQLQQVLTNLLGNARQALENRQDGLIRVTTGRGETPDTVRLEISDNGPGVPVHLVARIFDPFFTTKPAGSGTGLGLAIVMGIVREHGGEVRVSSPPGGGATFTVELPASVEGSETPSEAWRRSAVGLPPDVAREDLQPRAPRASMGRSRTRRVLVVEDEPTVAQLIADVLGDEGFRVEAVLSGREARRRAAMEDFDLIVCDMKMPDFDGARFYESLARGKNPRRPRFLFVTGDVLAFHTREFLERTGTPYLAKPFRMEELTKKVNQVLADEEESFETRKRNTAVNATKG